MMQGRGEDDSLAHLSKGEMVIPKRAQSAGLRALAAHNMKKIGLDPKDFTVGSAQRNPRTGLQEFADPITTSYPSGDPTLYGYGPEHSFFSYDFPTPPSYTSPPTNVPSFNGGGTIPPNEGSSSGGGGAALSGIGLLASLFGGKKDDNKISNLSSLSNIPKLYNLAQAISGGHLSSAANTGLGALFRASSLGAQYGTPGNVPAMFDLAGPGIESLLGAYPQAGGFGIGQAGGHLGLLESYGLGAEAAGSVGAAGGGGLGAGLGILGGIAAPLGGLAAFAAAGPPLVRGLSRLIGGRSQGNRPQDNSDRDDFIPSWMQDEPSYAPASSMAPFADVFRQQTAGISPEELRRLSPYLPGASFRRTGDTSGRTTFTTPGYYYTGAPSVMFDQGQAVDAYGQALQRGLTSASQQVQNADYLEFLRNQQQGREGGGL